jgi:hypothetical protein
MYIGAFKISSIHPNKPTFIQYIGNKEDGETLFFSGTKIPLFITDANKSELKKALVI